MHDNEYVLSTSRCGVESEEQDSGYWAVYGTIGLMICTMLDMDFAEYPFHALR